MAKVSNLNTRIYLDEFDLSGYLNASGLDIEQETPVVTCLSDGGPRRAVGNYDHTQDHTGFFDGADNAFDERAFVDLNTDEDHFLAQLFGANAENSRGYEAIVRLARQPRSAALGGAVLLNLQSEGSGGLVRCTVLRNATLVGVGNGTGRNLGATASGTVFAVVFRVLAFSGVNLTLALEESQNDGGADPYAAIAGLSNAFTAIGVSRKTTTAATEAWKRVAATSPGGFTSATVLVTAGTVQGT